MSNDAVTMSEADRNKLRDRLKDINAKGAAVEAEIEARTKDLRRQSWDLFEQREKLIEEAGVEIAGTCEVCGRLLFAGEMGNDRAYHDERALFCAQHAPTWGSVKEHWDWNTDEEYDEMRVDALGAVNAHLAAGGSLDDPILYVLEPSYD